MIQRRTLLSALPFVFISACARAQPSAPPSAPPPNTIMTSNGVLSEMIGGAGKVAWFSFAGTVRLSSDNADVRPATLLRAITVATDSASMRMFDIWQIAGSPALAADSQTAGTGVADDSLNDAGANGVWLMRSFAHPALDRPIESSRLSPVNARVMAIDATQIWLLEGALTQTAPALSAQAQAAFAAWRSA
jgi:hypothetical protein